jgi:hypothetical protein
VALKDLLISGADHRFLGLTLSITVTLRPFIGVIDLRLAAFADIAVMARRDIDAQLT